MILAKPLRSTLHKPSQLGNTNYQNTSEACLYQGDNNNSNNRLGLDYPDFLSQEPRHQIPPSFQLQSCSQSYRDPLRSTSSSSSSSSSDDLSPFHTSPVSSSSPTTCSPSYFSYAPPAATTKQYSQQSRQGLSSSSSQGCSYPASQPGGYTTRGALFRDDLCTDFRDIELSSVDYQLGTMNDDLLPSFATFLYDDDLVSDSVLEPDSVSDSGVSRSDSRSSIEDEDQPIGFGSLTQLTTYSMYDYENYDCYQTNDYNHPDSIFNEPAYPPLSIIGNESLACNRIYTDNQQSSPHSDDNDDGFFECSSIPEESLPNFESLQKTDERCMPRHRRNSNNVIERKRNIMRDSPCLEKERRKPGRKPGQVSNVLHLWEFMRDLLRSPSNQGIIEWISKSEGVFRVVNSTEVARLWGEKKKNKKKMTYEKLSRSLRYSRLEGYFSDLPKDKNYPKKLCFKFGPKSNNWH